MNALELADQLNTLEPSYTAMDEAADMIRQQHAQIQALQKTIDSLFGGLESSIALNKELVLRNQE